MKYNKKKDLSYKKLYKDDKDLLTFGSMDEFKILQQASSYMNDYLGNLDVAGNPLTDTRFEYNSLPEVIKNIVNYNYLVDSKEYLEEALTEFYKKFKSPHSPVMLDKITPFSRMQGALGAYHFTLNGKSGFITIQDYRKLMYSYPSYYTINQHTCGYMFLETIIHEMTHEKQEGDLLKLLSDDKLSKRDLISCFFQTASIFRLGRYNPEYYNRYYEFQAEGTAIKTMKEFLDKGYIENTRINNLIVYEMVSNFLTNFNIKKIIGEQKRYSEKIAKAYKLFSTDINFYETLNQYGVIESILASFPETLEDTYNNAVDSLGGIVNGKESWDILYGILLNYKKAIIDYEFNNVDKTELTVEQKNKLYNKIKKKADKEIRKPVAECIKQSIELNSKIYNDAQNVVGKHILSNMPDHFKNLEEIDEWLHDVLSTKGIPAFERFESITRKDIDNYSNTIEEEYNEIYNIAIDLQKRILEDMTDKEKAYLMENVSRSKYGNAENNSKYMTHIENCNSFNSGKSLYFLTDCIKLLNHEKEEKQKQEAREKRKQQKLAKIEKTDEITM